MWLGGFGEHPARAISGQMWLGDIWYLGRLLVGGWRQRVFRNPGECHFEKASRRLGVSGKEVMDLVLLPANNVQCWRDRSRWLFRPVRFAKGSV